MIRNRKKLVIVIVSVVLLIGFLLFVLFTKNMKNQDRLNQSSETITALDISENLLSGEMTPKSNKTDNKREDIGMVLEKEPILYQIQEKSFNNFTGTSEMKSVIELLMKLEKSLAVYYNINPQNMSSVEIKKINLSILILIRTNSYGHGIDKQSLMWQILGGEGPEELLPIITAFYNELEEVPNDIQSKYVTYKEIENIMDQMMNLSNVVTTVGEVDFPHLMSNLNCLYYDSEMNDTSELLFDTMTGWGGDLLSFYSELEMNSDMSKADYIKSVLVSEKSKYFDLSDFQSDIDAVNLSNLLITHNLLLSQTFLWYYDSWTVNQTKDFIASYGTNNQFEELVQLILFSEKLTQEDIRYFDIELIEAQGIVALFKEQFQIPELDEKEVNKIYDTFLDRVYSDFASE